MCFYCTLLESHTVIFFNLLSCKQYSYIMWSPTTKYSGRHYVALRWPPMAQTFITRFNQIDHTLKKNQWHTQDNKLSFWRGRGGGLPLAG